MAGTIPMGLHMPVREQTDARRRASLASHAKRLEQGLVKTTVWIKPEAKARLDQIKAAKGLSANEAINAAIMAFEPEA
jgi:hypothetical protein